MLTKDNGGLEAAHESEFLNDLMLEFVLTGKKSVLADYLERGGKIEDSIRDKILIALLRDEFTSENIGGKNSFRSVKIFTDVNSLMMVMQIGKTAACAHYAKNNLHRTPRAVEKQYDLGKAILASRFTGRSG